jgi:hypothetical protein
MEMAVKTMKGAARDAGWRRRQRWRRELLPYRRHHGGAPPPPLAPSFMASWEPFPMDMAYMGEAKKRGFWRLQFVGGGVPHDLGFLPLYSFSDFCHPI